MNHLEFQLFYTVFEECDVITRSARLINHSDASVTLDRCLSAQLDLTEDYSVITHSAVPGQERCTENRFPYVPANL